MASRLASSNIGIGYSNWRIAVAIRKRGGGAEIGFADGDTGVAERAPAALKAGDIIAVAPMGGRNYQLRTVPEVGGGMVVQNPVNGRVLAMQGGFDSRISSFQPRHTGAAAAGIDDQALRLCDGARKRDDAGVDHRRWALLRLAGRVARPESASAISAVAGQGRRRCAGALNSRAT
jgi:hypothetical protein